MYFLRQMNNQRRIKRLKKYSYEMKMATYLCKNFILDCLADDLYDYYTEMYAKRSFEQEVRH